jgi:hypothetical protein
LPKTSPAKKVNRMRGTPPPPTFSLNALADTTLLTQQEVAGFLRRSIPAVEKGRYENSDGLTWRYLDGWPRATAGSLKKVMAGDPTSRRPPVPQKKTAGAGA